MTIPIITNKLAEFKTFLDRNVAVLYFILTVLDIQNSVLKTKCHESAIR